MPTPTDSPLISVETLNGWRDHQPPAGALFIFDASYYLKHEAKDAQTLYAQAHIPGARFWDIERIADTDSPYPHMMPAPVLLAETLGAFGVGSHDTVVFYDHKGLFSAARGWWMLKALGHENVFVLNGGLPAWQAVGGLVESGEAAGAKEAEAKAYPAPAAYRYLATIADVEAQVSAKAGRILDARSPKRFRGEVPEPRPGLVAGHIPGSLNLFYGDLLDESGQRLKSPEALRKAFEAVLPPEQAQPLTLSCGSGVTACILALALAHAGLLDEVGGYRVYDGSWSEWGSVHGLAPYKS